MLEKDKMKKKMVHVSVNITYEDWEWVKKHDQFKFSGLLRWAIQQHREMTFDFSEDTDGEEGV